MRRFFLFFFGFRHVVKMLTEFTHTLLWFGCILYFVHTIHKCKFNTVSTGWMRFLYILLLNCVWFQKHYSEFFFQVVRIIKFFFKLGFCIYTLTSSRKRIWILNEMTGWFTSSNNWYPSCWVTMNEHFHFSCELSDKLRILLKNGLISSIFDWKRSIPSNGLSVWISLKLFDVAGILIETVRWLKTHLIFFCIQCI